MYEFKGLLYHIAFPHDAEYPVLSISVKGRREELFQMFDELKNAPVSVKLDKYRAKRSLNANNYAWKLITEIGNATRQSKDDVYLLMLKRYGQSDMVSAVAEVPAHHYFKYYEEAGESVLKGKLFKHYRVYKGSSEFDTKEMSIFIDGVVSEAKDLGIPTDTPEQIARMKDLWGE